MAKRGPGRPKRQGKTEKFCFVLTPKERERFEQASIYERYNNLSEWVRQTLHEAADRAFREAGEK